VRVAALRSPDPGANLRADSAERRTLDVIEAKLRPPRLRPGIVPRAALVRRLRGETASVVSLVASAGHGKTTLLAQWAAADQRPVVWVSIDTRDNDPLVLLEHVAAAVDRVHPHDRGRPFLLVLDNADLLRARAARGALSTLIAQAPDGSTVALGARTEPRLTAAARARGIRELGVDELALTAREARLLLQAANPALSEHETAELIALCEGWPAALYLAALSLRNGGNEPRPRRLGGSDRYLADYLRAEALSQLRPRDLRFLRRTSILDGLTGPLCDAVLHDEGSARTLEELAGTNLVVVPLQGRPGWYRAPRLVRDLLLHELAEEEPRLVPTFHRRAAEWYEHEGDAKAALDHARAAGYAARAASIITAVALPASAPGPVAGIEQAVARFEEAHQLERYPAVALHGSWIHAFRGRAADAERYLAIAERAAQGRGRHAAPFRPRVAVVRAALCRGGPQQMMADAIAALDGLPRASQWYPPALHLRGTAALLLGDADEADSLLAEAAAAAAQLGLAGTQMTALSQRSLLARQLDDPELADELAAEARQLAASTGLEGQPTFAIALAASAHASLRRGNWAEGRELVGAAEPLRPLVTEAVPWLAVEARLALARCYARLRDPEGARVVVAEIDRILAVRPQLGVLVEQARALRDEVAAITHGRKAPARLTPAELRLLPQLATHLSFREIAAEFDVSPNTVKTQAISIYRKLRVSGRSEAIAAAAQLAEPR
jgi:LuxR family transcriptional regulator, maltose regulon positive regulatory protein